MGTPSTFRESAIVVPAVSSYLSTLEWEHDELLQEMWEAGRRDGVPIVDTQTGQLLHLLVRMHRPKLVVEFGTAIGYSTVYMARAMDADATLVSFEIDADRHRQAGEYLSRSGAQAQLDLRLGDALELMRQLDGPVDFAFLDATKGEYGAYLELVLDRMPSGGVVAVDNALMSGAVATGVGDGSWSQQQVDAQRAFNRSLLDDPRLRASVLPVGDGLALAVRV